MGAEPVRTSAVGSVKGARRKGPRPWGATLANLFPLWLLSCAIMAEGFPRPPIPAPVATAFFVLAIVVSIALFLKQWATVELVLYSLFPFVLLGTFDEISTAYKTPFIVMCALILTAGIVGYECARSMHWRWLFLLVAVAVALVLASHAAHGFWDMAGDLGYERCFPDAYGCPPLTGEETPWWALFFGL